MALGLLQPLMLQLRVPLAAALGLLQSWVIRLMVCLPVALLLILRLGSVSVLALLFIGQAERRDIRHADGHTDRRTDRQ